jgi:hypothetical protein
LSIRKCKKYGLHYLHESKTLYLNRVTVTAQKRPERRGNSYRAAAL